MNEPTIWEGCYDAGWQDLLTPDAFSHPAKMARGLVFRIIAHLLDNGLIQPGQTVLDPFGGVGTTALPTLLSGLNYVGVELEPKFVELGRANIEMWQRKFNRMPKWSGQAVLLQGDSRRLVEVIAAAGGVVGSPPYEGCDIGAKEKRDGKKRIEALKRAQASGYNLGRESLRLLEKGLNKNTNLNAVPGGYGQTPGQLGSESPTTFWAAAAEILRQCAAVLPPGAPAVWVVKSFVKASKLVEFPDQWRQLCEASGFVTVEVIHAMLVKDNGAQLDLEGNKVRQHIERKSFFRRLHEAVTRAGKHWLTLSRDDQACLLAASRAEAWQYYHDHENDEEPAQYPGSAKIYHKAKLAAWLRDGKPRYDIATAIDHETVLVTRKI